MHSQFMFSSRRGACPWTAAALATLFVFLFALPCAGQKPTATAVATDRAAIPASNQFGGMNQWKLGSSGDVFFTSGGNSALFRWSQGARQRLLQTNDPIEVLGLPAEILAEVPPGSLLDSTGGLLQVNGPYAAFIVSVALGEDPDPTGVFVYNGSSYRLVDVGLNAFSQLFLNSSGHVAISGNSGYLNTGIPRIYLETSTGVVKLVAEQMADSPVTGYKYGTLQLIGFNDNHKAAFLTQLQGPGNPWAVFVSDGTTVSLVVKSGDDVPGPAGPTFNLLGIVGNYALNNQDKVAFVSNVSGGPPGIWIGSGSAAPVELVRQGSATGIDGWGNYNGPFTLRGFNNSGKVLFDSNINPAPPTTPNYALFLKELGNPAQVVFYRGQAGGPGGGTFDTTMQASLNDAGQVAFLVRNATGLPGWYLYFPPSPLQAIAIQGDTTPIGGKYGLAGRSMPAQINSSGQVLFMADVLNSNAVALFLWASGSEPTCVVSTNDSLPAGALTVLRFPNVATDQEVMLAIFKTGGKRTFYVKPLDTGMIGLRRIVGEFDPAPDGGVLMPGAFAMNSLGQLVFSAGILRPYPGGWYPAQGIIASEPGTGLGEVAVTGDSVPSGAPGEKFGVSFGAPQINYNLAQTAFWATTDAAPNAAGIFLATKDVGIEKVVHTLDAWPTAQGGTFANFNQSLSLNTGGKVAFQASRTTSGSGLFVGTAGSSPLPVATTADSAPIGNFTGFPTPIELNADGKVAFVANYGTSGPPPTSGSGVFLGSTAAAPEALATTGSLASGTSAHFTGFNSASIDLNSSGKVAFWAALDGTGNKWNGWFLGATGPTVLPRMLQNQPLPGSGNAGMLAGGTRLAVLANSGEMAIYVPDVWNGIQPRIVIAGVDGTLRNVATIGEKAQGTGSDFGKLYPTLTVVPSNQFLFSAVLVNGPAKAGVFRNNQ